jgi:alpha-galactosidase
MSGVYVDAMSVRAVVRITLAVAVAAAVIPVVLLGVHRAEALDNGLGRTSPMGWNDWNTFGCGVSDTLIRQSADTLVSSGMASAGYQYVNIDDCWSQSTRDASGNLRADSTKFPTGIKPVADYVHSLGLKIGLYAEAGSVTCAGFPGSLGHEQQDANLFASWGIDYLKYDNCGDHGGLTNQQRYTTMRDALRATGRPIFYNLCEWGQDAVWTWGAQTGNSWRTTGDVQATFSSILSILDSQVGLESYAGPGGWNDPDMLEVGNGALTDSESRAHFSLWALLNAPLIAGNDLRTMTAATRTILTNTDVIAVDQDWGGKQGYKLRDDGDTEVWLKPMANGSRSVVLLNRGPSTATISVTASTLGLGAASSYVVRDLWTHTTTTTSATISATVASHAAAMYLVSGGNVMPSSSATATATATATPTPSATQTSTPSASTTRTPAASPTTPPGSPSCIATYRIVNAWRDGFQSDVTVAAGSQATTGWRVTWAFPNGQTISQSWSATVTQTGAAVTATNLSWNGTLAPGASTTFGFIATATATNGIPTPTCTAS